VKTREEGKMQRRHGRPEAQGLYDPAHEHDACGVGFVAQIDGTRSHALVHQGIEVLERLEHRGACGCDPETGDGAGILIQLPDRFLHRLDHEAGVDHLDICVAFAKGVRCGMLPESISRGRVGGRPIGTPAHLAVVATGVVRRERARRPVNHRARSRRSAPWARRRSPLGRLSTARRCQNADRPTTSSAGHASHCHSLVA